MQDIEAVIKILKSPVTRERVLAAKALSKVDNPRVIEPLITCLYDSQAVVRETAAWALGFVGNLQAIEPLIEMMHDPTRCERPDSDGDTSNVEQNALIKIAKRLGTPAIDILLRYVKDGFVIYVLGQSGNTQAVGALIALLEDETASSEHIAAIYALGELRDPRAVPILRQAVAQYDPHAPYRKQQEQLGIRAWAKEALKKIPRAG